MNRIIANAEAQTRRERAAAVCVMAIADTKPQPHGKAEVLM